MRERCDGKSIEQLVNDQCIQWEEKNRIAQEESRIGRVRPVLIISTQEGSIGRGVAKRLSEELQMDLFGEEIIHKIAQEARLSERIVRTMDERGWSYADEILNRITGKSGMSAEAYFRHLVRVIVTIARHGNSIVVGHGAAYILRAPMNLHVRMVAPLNARIRAMSEGLGISAGEAQRRIKILDQERRDFVRQYFHADIDDVHYFDLVINNEFVDTHMAVQLVKEAFIEKSWHWANGRRKPRHRATREEEERSNVISN